MEKGELVVLESGKERLEQLGGEVPSLAVKKGSAFLQCSWCPAEMLPGVWAATGSALDCALEPCASPPSRGRRRDARRQLGLWAGWTWASPALAQGSGTEPSFPAAHLGLQRLAAVAGWWAKVCALLWEVCAGCAGIADGQLELGSDEAPGCWLAAAPGWGTSGFAGETLSVCCARFLVAVARGCPRPRGCGGTARPRAQSCLGAYGHPGKPWGAALRTLACTAPVVLVRCL